MKKPPEKAPGKTIRGPWKRGQSGNPKGRPKGSGLTGELRRAIAERVPGIVAGLIAQAEAGDTQAARILLDRVMPALKPAAALVEVQGLASGTALQRAEAALAAAGAGELPPDIASQLVAAIGVLVKIREAEELEARLTALEARNAP